MPNTADTSNRRARLVRVGAIALASLTAGCIAPPVYVQGQAGGPAYGASRISGYQGQNGQGQTYAPATGGEAGQGSIPQAAAPQAYSQQPQDEGYAPDQAGPQQPNGYGQDYGYGGGPLIIAPSPYGYGGGYYGPQFGYRIDRRHEHDRSYTVRTEHHIVGHASTGTHHKGETHPHHETQTRAVAATAAPHAIGLTHPVASPHTAFGMRLPPLAAPHTASPRPVYRMPGIQMQQFRMQQAPQYHSQMMRPAAPPMMRPQMRPAMPHMIAPRPAAPQGGHEYRHR